MNTNSLKVVHLVAAAVAGPNGNRGVNGPEKRTLDMLDAIGKRGVTNVVIYPDHGALYDQFQRSPAVLEVVDIGGVSMAARILVLRRIFRRQGDCLIHSQGPGSVDFAAAIASIGLRAPLVVTRPVMIADLRVSRLRRLAFEMLDCVTRRLAACVVAVSRDGETRLRSAWLADQKRVVLVHNGVDLGVYTPRREDGARPEVVLGMCAQLTANKCWHAYLEVVADVRSRNPRVVAYVIGDGPMRAELERYAAKLGLEGCVRFVGHQQDVAAHLRILDVFLLLSRREGLSVAVLEAMATGLPCVVSRVGGASDQIEDGVNGFLVDPANPRDATRSVEKLLADPELRRSMGRASRKLAEERFCQSRMHREYLGVYRAAACLDH